VLSNRDFGCNTGDVYYLGVNWGADNDAVNDFIAVHAVDFPCASGLQGLGNDVNLQYEIVSHITVLVVMPDRQIAGQFFDPVSVPTRDTLNNLLLSLGAEYKDCSVGLSDERTEGKKEINVFPNPIYNHAEIAVFVPEKGHYQFIITNNLGRKVQSYQQNLQRGLNKLSIDVHSLHSGVYYVTVKNNKNYYKTTTIIKQ